MNTLTAIELEILKAMLERLMDKEILSTEECRVKEKVDGIFLSDASSHERDCIVEGGCEWCGGAAH